MKFLIVDDHAVVRRGLREIVASRPGWEVGGEAAAAEAVLPALHGEHFDAVILDVTLGDRSGIEILGAIRRDFPTLPILILSIHDELQYAARCLRAGASGYVQKNTSPDILIEALERILSGRAYISENVVNELAKDLMHGDGRARHTRLSAREFEVFRLIANGRTVSEIAGLMGISVKTASTYRSRILVKTGFTSNAEIVLYAVRNGLVTL